MKNAGETIQQPLKLIKKGCFENRVKKKVVLQRRPFLEVDCDYSFTRRVVVT